MAALQPRRKRSLLRTLLILALGMILLVTGLLGYLQTSHGFRHVIVPLAASAVPGALQVQDGVLTLPATVSVSRLTYDHSEAGLAVRAERLVLAVSWRSFFTQQFPLVEQLEVTRSEVRLQQGMLPTTQPDTPPEVETEAGVRVFPVAIGRARIEGLTLVIQTPEGIATARDTTLEIDDLRPGRTGRFGLRSDLEVSRGDGKSHWSGELTLAGTVEPGADSRRFKWSATNALVVRQLPGRAFSRRGTEPIVLEQTFSGDYDFDLDSLRAFSSITARRNETSLGALSLTFSSQRKDGAPLRDISLAIQEVTDETLNLWLGDETPVRVHSALITGRAKIHASGPRYAIESELTGKRIQIRSEAHSPPPLDLTMKQTAVFDAESRDVGLKSLDVTVSDGNRIKLVGALDQPMTINLDPHRVAASQQGAGQAKPAQWALAVQDVEVEDLRPWLALTGRDVLTGVRTGRLHGTITVSTDEKGNTVDLTGHLQALNVMVEGPTPTVGVGPLSFDNQVRATVSNLTSVVVDPWTSRVTLNGKPVGRARVTGAFQVTARPTVQRADAALTLLELPGEALNPIIALWSPARIQGARFNGAATLKMADHVVAWDADLRGTRVRVSLPDLPRATAPLDMRVAQAGRFDRLTGALDVEGASVQLTVRGQPVISAALARPLHVNLRGGGADSATGAAGEAQPITFTVEIRHLGVEQLRSRLALFGVGALGALKTGDLDGRLQGRWQTATRTVDVTGRLDVEDLRLVRGGTQSGGPMTLRSQLAATVTESSQVHVKEWKMQASVGSQAIAEASIAGSAGIKEGSMDLVLEASAGDVALMLDRLALLDPRQRKLIVGGDLTGEVRVVSNGQNEPLSVKTTVRARAVGIKMAKARPLTYAFDAHGELEMDAARTEVQFKQFAMSLKSGPASGGTVTMTGRWPLASSSQNAHPGVLRPGALTVTVREWDGGPLAELLDLTPGRAPGPVLVNADVMLTREPASGSLAIRGSETLGPIRAVHIDKGPMEATLHIEHDLVKRGDELHAAAFTLTAERPHGLPDRVTANGAIRLGTQPAAQIKGEVTSLDAGWYTDLLSAPATDAKAREMPPRSSGATPSAAQGGVGVPMVLNADVGIGTVVYRTLTIGPGRLLAKGTGDNLQVTLQPTGFAEGTVEGEVVVAMTDGQPGYTWSAKGQGVNTKLLDQLLEAGKEPRLTGPGAFTTSGTGRGQGDALKQSLWGTVVIDVTDGAFIRSPFLDYLAKQTRIAQLQAMGYDRIHGELRIDKGVIHIDRLDVEGSAAKLEGSGTVGLDRRVDLRVMTKIGPKLADKVRNSCVTSMLKTPDGFLALRFAVMVTGTVEEPVFSPVTARGAHVKGAAGGVVTTLTELLRGCKEETPAASEPVPGQKRSGPLGDAAK